MWLLDQWAERNILDAQKNGDFDNLPGEGAPIHLDDDSHVPVDLRAGYRLLKNAGCLPLELELRKEALEIVDLLKIVNRDHADYHLLHHRLTVLELRLRQAGLSTEFLHNEYAFKLQSKMNQE